jgi:hypothetical protein
MAVLKDTFLNLGFLLFGIGVKPHDSRQDMLLLILVKNASVVLACCVAEDALQLLSIGGVYMPIFGDKSVVGSISDENYSFLIMRILQCAEQQMVLCVRASSFKSRSPKMEFSPMILMSNIFLAEKPAD